MTVFTWMRDLARDEEGASAIEYAILVAMVALIIISFMPGVQDGIKKVFGAIKDALGTL